MNCGLGVLLLEFCDQAAERSALFLRAGVTRLKALITAANIADSNGMGVVPGAVGANLLDRAASMNAAV